MPELLDKPHPFIDRYGVFVLPDGETAVLIGHIFGHPYVREGNLGRTSPIRFIDFASGVAVTMNRTYRLGERLPVLDAEMARALSIISSSLNCEIEEIEFIPPTSELGGIN